MIEKCQIPFRGESKPLKEKGGSYNAEQRPTNTHDKMGCGGNKKNQGVGRKKMPFISPGEKQSLGSDL